VSKKILFTLIAIVLSLGLIGGAFAYFSDTETSEDNTFTAGTLDLVLSNDGTNYFDGVTATWQSPSNWAPGDPEVVASLNMKDIGTIGADLVKVRGLNLVESDNGYNEAEGAGSANNIADHINITTLKYTEKGVEYDVLGYFTTVFGDGAAPLTLKEFATSPYSMVFWIGGWPPPEDYLPANGARIEWIKMGFTFEQNAGNAYQSDTATFDLTVWAAQDYSQVTLLGKSGACAGYVEE
jgi:predicted ribosomally synthesized peptide with SipW-like signal peptide